VRANDSAAIIAALEEYSSRSRLAIIAWLAAREQ
jgi:hypothetical protein